MKLQIKKGSTSVSLYLFLQDSSLTTGAGKTGLVYNTASLVAYYVRPGGSATAITLATQTVTGAWSSGGFVLVSDANMPGVYRFDVPDAVLATGVNSVVVMIHGATNLAQTPLEIELVAYDPQDTVRLGLTAMPNVASGNAGALLISGTGTAALSVSGGVGQADVALLRGSQPNVLQSGRIDCYVGAFLASVIDATAIASSAFTGSKFALGFLSETKIAADTFTLDHFATGAFYPGIFGAGAITADSIATDAIGADEISAGAVTKIQDGLLKPTVAGRTLDVEAGGTTGIDWGNIANPDTFQVFGSTAIFSVQSAVVGGINEGVITALSLNADALAAIQAGLATATNLSTLLTRIPGTVQPQTGDAYARIGAPAGASHAVDVAAVKSDTGAIKIKTDNLPGSPAAVGSQMKLETADGVTHADMLEAIMAVLFGEAVPAGSTVEFKKRDGTTTKVTVTYGAADGERTASVIN